ncbi:hypothetical protein RUND412_005280 [Rhizina undulata]
MHYFSLMTSQIPDVKRTAFGVSCPISPHEGYSCAYPSWPNRPYLDRRRAWMADVEVSERLRKDGECFESAIEDSDDEEEDEDDVGFPSVKDGNAAISMDTPPNVSHTPPSDAESPTQRTLKIRPKSMRSLLSMCLMKSGGGRNRRRANLGKNKDREHDMGAGIQSEVPIPRPSIPYTQSHMSHPHFPVADTHPC